MATTCPRCEETYDRSDRMRFRAGRFYDPEADEVYEQLCEDCHREVVRS